MQTTLVIDPREVEIVCHHMPDICYPLPKLEHGQTLRHALNVIRNIDWGDMGGTYPIRLSDGTYMQVELTPASDGGELLNSQRVRRYDGVNEKTIRYYKVR